MNRDNKPSPLDKEIKCVDCHTVFTFSEGEQRFYSSKGLEPPKRCGDCRKSRKASLDLSRGTGGDEK